MGDIDNNPLRDIYESLWQMLEASAAFVALVPPANRLRLSRPGDEGELQPAEEGSLSSLAPSVRIVQIGISTDPFCDSRQSALAVRFAIQAASNSPYLDDLQDAQWAIFRASTRWQDFLYQLRWEEAAYVVSCRTLHSQEIPQGRKLDWDESSGRGWSTVLACEVACQFVTENIQEAA
jgi:hypothetical protein